MKYTVGHTVDESGARYANPDGVTDLETDDFDEAKTLADELTAKGQCGYVERDDGFTLTPGNCWV